MERIRERCDYLLESKGGRRLGESRRPSSQPISPICHAPLQMRVQKHTLPPWDVTSRHVSTAFENAFSLFNFIYRPSFEARFHVFHAARNAGLETNVEDLRFEALLNSMCALGEIFSGSTNISNESADERSAMASVYANHSGKQSTDKTH